MIGWGGGVRKKGVECGGWLECVCGGGFSKGGFPKGASSAGVVVREVCASVTSKQ